jgi:hypothetical protein
MITLYTRIKNLTSAQDAALSAYAERFNRVARHLAADMAREQRAGASFKNAYLRRFDITARQFNAVRRYVEGLADNRVENLKNLENTLSGKIEATQKLLPKLEKQIAKARAAKSCASSVERLKHRLHQKKRRLGHVRERRSQAIAEQRWPYASGLCFGGRKLFNAQHHLRENGYADHAQWRADWRSARSSQFIVLGSSDEMAGVARAVWSAFNRMAPSGWICDCRRSGIPRDARTAPVPLSGRKVAGGGHATCGIIKETATESHPNIKSREDVFPRHLSRRCKRPVLVFHPRQKRLAGHGEF